MRFGLFYLALVLPMMLTAQTLPNRSPLTIEQIMDGEAFVGYLPQDVRWSPDSRTIYFSWNPDGDTLRSLYKAPVSGGRPERVMPDEETRLVEAGEYDRERRRMVYHKFGDLFLLDVAAGQVRQLTETVDREVNPRFSDDGRYVVFERDNNLYALEVANGMVRQLTQFIRGQEESEKEPNGYRAILRQEAVELSGILRERRLEQEVRERRDEALQPERPRKIYYGGNRIGGLTISPDLRFATYRLTEPANDRTEVPDYVTESGFVEMLPARSKVGSPQDTYQMGVYDRQKDTTYKLDFKSLPGIYQKPAFLAEYHQGDSTWKNTYDKPRDVFALGPFWSADGKAALVVRSLDAKDRWIVQLQPETGQLKVIDHQHDDAWIGGPGVGWYHVVAGTIGWLPDNRTLYFQSEETGYSHLYLYDIQTGQKRPLTQGQWEVLDLQLSRDGRSFYLTANKENPFEQHLYRLPVAGGTMERLTNRAGGHEVVLSPDERYFADRYSFSNEPWELFVQETKAGARPRQLTESTTEAFEKYEWREPEIVRFRASDGVDVPARLYRPAGGSQGGPAVIFVHGAGYLQNVHRWWSSYFREYMFHNFLADNGYTVLDIDYRASSGYGRDWRTAIYRHMGGRDLQDHIDGARYLVEQVGIDKDRIGIYGGSYGGFITLMALFNHPGTFKAGAALRSVTDWSHYNHAYTANILNTPAEDSIAFRRSSPIYFAEGLQDRLLILHGMVDVNVQFQDVVRLAQRLIELGKENWEFAVFPVEDHGFMEPSSWSDEYRRIYKLFVEELQPQRAVGAPDGSRTGGQ